MPDKITSIQQPSEKINAVFVSERGDGVSRLPVLLAGFSDSDAGRYRIEAMVFLADDKAWFRARELDGFLGCEFAGERVDWSSARRFSRDERVLSESAGEVLGAIQDDLARSERGESVVGDWSVGRVPPPPPSSSTESSRSLRGGDGGEVLYSSSERERSSERSSGGIRDLDSPRRGSEPDLSSLAGGVGSSEVSERDSEGERDSERESASSSKSFSERFKPW